MRRRQVSAIEGQGDDRSAAAGLGAAGGEATGARVPFWKQRPSTAHPPTLAVHRRAPATRSAAGGGSAATRVGGCGAAARRRPTARRAGTRSGAAVPSAAFAAGGGGRRAVGGGAAGWGPPARRTLAGSASPPRVHHQFGAQPAGPAARPPGWRGPGLSVPRLPNPQPSRRTGAWRPALDAHGAQCWAAGGRAWRCAGGSAAPAAALNLSRHRGDRRAGLTRVTVGGATPSVRRAAAHSQRTACPTWRRRQAGRVPVPACCR